MSDFEEFHISPLPRRVYKEVDKRYAKWCEQESYDKYSRFKKHTDLPVTEIIEALKEMISK